MNGLSSENSTAFGEHLRGGLRDEGAIRGVHMADSQVSAWRRGARRRGNAWRVAR
jgi:hypothetical protein